MDANTPILTSTEYAQAGLSDMPLPPISPYLVQYLRKAFPLGLPKASAGAEECLRWASQAAGRLEVLQFLENLIQENKQ